MKKSFLILVAIFLIFGSSIAQQSTIATYTVQVTNPPACNGCCSATLALNGLYNSCLAGVPVSFALLTPTTALPPLFGNNTYWVNLCNGTYTIAANFFVAIPPNCSTQFTCSLIYGFTPTKLNANETISPFVSIYPNPATDKLYLKINQSETTFYNAALNIYNQLGQVMQHDELKFINSKAIVNTSNLPSGTYIITITTIEGFEIKKRLVLEH
jgi:hypothetical protein